MDVHLENEQEVVGELSDSIHPWMHFKRSRMGGPPVMGLSVRVLRLKVFFTGSLDIIDFGWFCFRTCCRFSRLLQLSIGVSIWTRCPSM